MKTETKSREDMEVVNECPNCGGRVIGRYCSDCGQLQDPNGSSLKQILTEFFREITNSDSRLLRSVSTLLLRPGQITADHLAHKQARYLPPFRVYILVNLVLYFALNLFSGSSTVSLHLDIDVLQGTRNAEAARELTASLIPQIGFVLLPIAALILKMLYLRRSMPFGDHFVAALHIKSAVALILCLAAVLQVLISGIRVLTDGWIPQFGNLLLSIAALICCIHIGIGLRRVYGGRWMMTILRSILLLLSYLIVVVAVILSFVLITALTLSTAQP